MIKLVNNEQPKSICVNDMQDGDIGVVVVWSDGRYLGRIVQRYKDHLLVVGEQSGREWDTIFNSGLGRWEDCHVRLLEKGETLIVEQYNTDTEAGTKIE